LKSAASQALPEPKINKNGEVRSRAIGAETEASIIKIATEEFALHGYESVSMRTIASRVDITPPSIYLYFKDKRSLYVSCCLSSISALCSQMTAHLHGKKPAARRLEIFLGKLADELFHNPDPTRLFLRALIERDDDVLARIEHEAVHELFVMVKDAIAEVNGKANASESAASLLGLTLGLIQFSKFLESAGYPLSFNRNPKALAQHVMSTIVGAAD